MGSSRVKKEKCDITSGLSKSNQNASASDHEKENRKSQNYEQEINDICPDFLMIFVTKTFNTKIVFLPELKYTDLNTPQGGWEDDPLLFSSAAMTAPEYATIQLARPPNWSEIVTLLTPA